MHYCDRVASNAYIPDDYEKFMYFLVSLVINDLFKLIQESMQQASDAKYSLKDVQKLASTYNAK